MQLDFQKDSFEVKQSKQWKSEDEGKSGIKHLKWEHAVGRRDVPSHARWISCRKEWRGQSGQMSSLQWKMGPQRLLQQQTKLLFAASLQSYCCASLLFSSSTIAEATITITITAIISITNSAFCRQFQLFCHPQTWLEMAMHSLHFLHLPPPPDAWWI